MSFEQSQAAHFHVDNGAAIAAELTRLSMKEREDILDDIHGVASSTPETPESIQTALNELHTTLKRKCAATHTSTATTASVNSTPISVYQMALQSDNPSYVLDPAFGLLFLRSEHFNVWAAAQKILRFLQTKLELFGPSKLCHNITIDDLGPDGVAALENGQFQLLPFRDRSGRAIFCFPAQLYNSKIPLHADLRHLFYVVMAALEDPETQIKGVVMMPWGLPRGPPWDAWRVNNLMDSLPYHVKGWHAVLAESVSPLFSWLLSLLDARTRVRMRMHNGTHQEILYSLMTFGIPTSVIPVQPDGSVDLTHHLQWIQNRRKLEASRQRRQLPPSSTAANPLDATRMGGGGDEHATSQFSGYPTDPMSDSSVGTSTSCNVFLPTSKDVLFGRGKPFQQHPGNIRLSLTLDSMRERYNGASRHEKTVLAMDIVKTFQTNGTRFLRRVSNDVDGILWEEVNDSEAREKVSQLFRSIRQGKHHQPKLLPHRPSYGDGSVGSS